MWVYIDTVTGLPIKPEMHNNGRHRVRELSEENDRDKAWPETIVYRSFHHQTATE